MKYCYIAWLSVLIFGFFTLFPEAPLAAEKGTTSVGIGIPATEMTDEWSLSTSITYLPSADLKGIAGSIGIGDYRIKTARNLKLDERMTLTLGGGYSLKQVDSPTAALPGELHTLFLEAGARYRINDRSFASIKLYPGIYSDFRGVSTDDLRMPVLALGGYNFDSGFSVVGGCAYRFGYHASQFIPALGFSYQPDQSWRFDVIAPRPAITYSASRKLQLFVAGDFASDEYELNDLRAGAKAIKYSDYKVMAGAQYVPAASARISTSLGYAFDRKIMFFEGNRPNIRIDDVPFIKVSLDIGW